MKYFSVIYEDINFMICLTWTEHIVFLVGFMNMLCYFLLLRIQNSYLTSSDGYCLGGSLYSHSKFHPQFTHTRKHTCPDCFSRLCVLWTLVCDRMSPAQHLKALSLLLTSLHIVKSWKLIQVRHHETFYISDLSLCQAPLSVLLV